MKRGTWLIFAGLVVLFAWLADAPAPVRAQKDAQHSSGRALPALPAITQTVMFNTPEADKILTALQVFPHNNAWNEDISKRPIHPNSKNIVASSGASA